MNAERALLTEGRDPRVVKRARAGFRRGLIALLSARMQCRRCWWTWPLGHDFGSGWVTLSPAYRVTCCSTCGKPYSWQSFDAWDVWRFASDSDLLSDDELEAWDERRRSLP